MEMVRIRESRVGSEDRRVWGGGVRIRESRVGGEDRRV
jgi:hypothetical protein